MKPGPSHPHDLWTGGDAYERYVGRWSRLVARVFVPWMGIGPGSAWIDVGCGTGAVTQTIIELAHPGAVLAVDPSEALLAYAREAVGDSRVSFQVGRGEAIPTADGSYDAVVSGLALNFMPDTRAALGEWRRVVRVGGAIGAYVWDYAGQMQFLRYYWDAAIALDADARSLDEAVRFPIANAEGLSGAFEAAGLTQVTTHAIDVPTRFAKFDDLWQPFLGGQGPAPAYAMRLPAVRREALRSRLQDSLPVGPDGSIDLIARAWAVRGLRE
jgi:ubiquinone/menaquinone biosynthesis C-methylase UbiE